MSHYTRSITFTIPGTGKSPSVRVAATEVDGTLVFTTDVVSSSQQTADLRGLFFNLNNDSKLAGLTFTGTQVSGFDTVDVIDLGNGANMQGAAAPFDVGVRFGTSGIGKDNIQTTSFTLSNTAGDLTLDDIAHVQFGARTTSVGGKLVVTAPAAPAAHDDTYTIFEDGQSGLASPSHNPVGTLFQVLSNDTDADGNVLTITNVHNPLHGTASIVDGADADSLVGDAILYTPTADYSGADNFEYLISDNHGGTDFAKVDVSITAVADKPTLSYEILAGAAVNQIIVRVTADQTDADSSEFIDRIELSGIPAGVTVNSNGINPAGEPDQIVQDFLLTLPTNTDTNFDLGITAVAKETSNGDEESATKTVPIVVETNAISENKTFQALNQSIWTTGDEFVFNDNRFLGIDISDSGGNGGLISTDWAYDVKAGFQSDLHFEGGDIDAQIPWQFDFGTIYNKTTDVLVIDTNAALLGGGSFQTDGPSLDYMLNFIFNYAFHANVGLYINLEPLGTVDESLFTIDAADNTSSNIIDYHSDTSLPINFTLPPPLGSISVELAWPNLEVSGTETPSTGIYQGNGSSNNALNLNLDIDQALADIFFAGANPFDLSVNLGVAGGTFELLDADVAAGLNFLQDFLLDAGTIAATLHWENGSTSSFNFGDELNFANASNIDAGGDGDGLVEFTVGLDLVGSTLANDTNLGFNVGWNLDLFKGTWWYDILVASDNGSWGPLVDLGQNQIPVAELDVFSDVVAIGFAEQSLNLFA
jgi:hypothetical protein